MVAKVRSFFVSRLNVETRSCGRYVVAVVAVVVAVTAVIVVPALSHRRNLIPVVGGQAGVGCGQKSFSRGSSE